MKKKRKKDWMTPEQRAHDDDVWRRLEQRIQERKAAAERRRTSS